MSSIADIRAAATEVFGDLPGVAGAALSWGRQLAGKTIVPKDLDAKLTQTTRDLIEARKRVLVIAGDTSVPADTRRANIDRYNKLAATHRRNILKLSELMQVSYVTPQGPFPPKPVPFSQDDRDALARGGLGYIQFVGAGGAVAAIAIGTAAAAAIVGSIYFLSSEGRKFVTDLTLTPEQRAAVRKAEAEHPFSPVSFDFGKAIPWIAAIGAAVLILPQLVKGGARTALHDNPRIDPGGSRARYFRARVRPPSAFKRGSFRTIPLPGSRGALAVIGRPKGKMTTRTQAYRFPKSEYTKAAIQSFLARHKRAA